MTAAFSALLPVFAILFAGFACRRRSVFGPTAASELSRFVVWLGLPALLFDIVAHSTWAQVAQPGFYGSFGLATLALSLLVFVVRRRSGRRAADAGLETVAATYSNTGYLGFPLALLALGPGSQTLVTLASLFVLFLPFAVGMVVIEADLAGGLHRGTLRRVALSLAKNPLIVAPLAGAAVAALHWTIPAPLESVLRLFGAASSPVALVSLGAFLAEKRSSGAEQLLPLWLTMVKLVAHPLLTWLLATMVFHLPRPVMQVAVLMAALPTGTGPFMLAEFYKRGEAVSAQATLWSTLLSLLTLTVLLVFLVGAG